MRTWLEESSIISWDSRCRLFCGGNCVEHDRQVIALRSEVLNFDGVLLVERKSAVSLFKAYV